MAKRIQRSAPRPSAARERPAPGADEPRPQARRRGRVPDQLVTEFTTQLATLSGAGIPVVKALTILGDQTRPGPFKGVLADLVDDVSAGTPLSEAMGKHPRVFDRLYSNMVRAGESGGVLDTILERLAGFREKAAEVQAKTRGAMIYPVVVLLVAIAVVSVVIIFVIPRFQDIFESFGSELPRATRILLDVSGAVLSYWYLFFGLPPLLLLLHRLLVRRRAGYRLRVHALLLRVPYLGAVLSKSLIARFARTFGTLIEAGVPHLEALAIVRDTTGNAVVAQGVESIRKTVREGEGLARPMGATGIFDDLVVNMVDVGEETGELDGMLLKVAVAYETQVDRRIDALFKVLEPALLVAMAAVVFFIVVALYLPLLQIMGELGGS